MDNAKLFDFVAIVFLFVLGVMLPLLFDYTTREEARTPAVIVKAYL